MFRPRIIPSLLLHNDGLVKTIKFKNPRYIGDPINAVKIFNEKEVDELVIFDIDATIKNRDPNYDLIEAIVSEAFMPICYGGGVKEIDQMRRLFNLGIEKISISSEAVRNQELIRRAAEVFGSQSVVITLDIKQKGMRKHYQVVTHNGNNFTGRSPVEMAKTMQELGAGELIINSVDYDGIMKDYDNDIIKKIVDAIDIPVVAVGGAGSLQDMKNVILKTGVSAACAGSLFVYHGRLKAVLINYPSQEELQAIFKEM